MPIQLLTLTLAAAFVLTVAPPANAGKYSSAAAADHALRQRAYTECNLRLAHLPRYRGYPQRYLAVEGCVSDVTRRR